MPLSFLQRFFEKPKRSTSQPSPSKAPSESASKADENAKSLISQAETRTAEPVAKRKSLFAFVDLRDPFTVSEIAGEDLPGPILSILSAREFDSVFLLCTSETCQKAAETMAEIGRRYPECQVRIRPLPVSNPKDYSSLMAGVSRYGSNLLQQSETEENYICVSSGTAEMRAVWFLLTTLGMVKATLLQVGTPASPLFGKINVKEVRLADLALPLGLFTVPVGRARRFFGESPERRESENEVVNGAATEEPQREEALEEPEILGDIEAGSPEAQAGATGPEAAEGEPGELAEQQEVLDRLNVPLGGTELQKESTDIEREWLPVPGLDDALQELGIYVGSAVLRHAAERAGIAADSHHPVLLLGETGTGKERFAHLIHRLSPRFGQEMVSVNCAAIPASLAESYLFGHVKGAFSDARYDKEGIFETADQTTLFLDEIAELTLEVQAKLLRVIEQGVVQRLGTNKPRKVDVRIVAATNRDLTKEVSAGRFRQDLYYRLEVVQIKLPALRERRSEIPELALALLRQINQRRQKPRRLTTEALSRLEHHLWPGNVRELSNVLERSVLYSRGDLIDSDDLFIDGDGAQAPILALPEPREGFSIEDFLAEVREQIILRALTLCNGNQAQAAAMLGISKQAVNKFLAGRSDN